MANKIVFTENTALTSEIMNQMLQKSDIVESRGTGEDKVISQKGITELFRAENIAINPINEFGNATTLQEFLNLFAQIITGNKVVELLQTKEINLVD